MQLNANNQKLLMVAALLVTAPVFAVDLVGVHDLAAKSDPQLQAAAYRREATGENERQAWANLLPTLSAGAARDYGDNDTRVSATEFTETIKADSDIDTQAYRFDLRQSLYAQSNYEQLDVARGQVSQAAGLFHLPFDEHGGHRSDSISQQFHYPGRFVFIQFERGHGRFVHGQGE